MLLNTLVQDESPKVHRRLTRFAALLFILTLATCFVELFWAYHRLPERVHAHFPSWTHFAAEGPKWIFVLISGAIPAAIAVAALISIRLVRTRPETFVQIPNRDYWMAPERREQTLDMIVSRIYLLGAVKFVADAIFIYEAVRANQAGATELDPGLLFVLACGFILAKLALAGHLLWLFRYPERGIARLSDYKVSSGK
jgi:hypothetical protein